MSDELIKSQNQRIAELDKQKTDLQIALRDERRQRKDLKAQLDDLVSTAEGELGETARRIEELEAERDTFRARAEAAPDEKDRQIADLQTSIRTRDYRDAFREQVGGELADGVTVEDLWHFAGFDPAGTDKLAPEQITELVGKVREAKPVLFVKPDPGGNPGGTPKDGGTQRPAPRPLTLGDSGSRGARDAASGSVAISRLEMGTPGWMTKNKVAAQAFKDGTLVVTD